jgi:hypothetical protein
MQDVDFAAIDAVNDRPAEDELRVTWDERANQPVSFLRPAEQIERERRVIRMAFARAKSMEVRPDTDPSVPTPYDELVPERITDLQTIGQAAWQARWRSRKRLELPILVNRNVMWFGKCVHIPPPR